MGFSRVNLEWMAMPPFSDERIWKSEDGQYKVCIHEWGEENDDRGRIKEICLRKKSIISTGSLEIMGIREIINNDKNIKRSVFLDARDDRNGNHLTAKAEYVNIAGYGKLIPPNQWSSPMENEKTKIFSDKHLYSLYREEQVINGIRNLSELPPYIYIEATIEKFINQINRRDFSQPVLVARSVSREEIKNIDMITRKKYDNKK